MEISFYETRNYCNTFLANGPFKVNKFQNGFFSGFKLLVLSGTNTSGKSITGSLSKLRSFQHWVKGFIKLHFSRDSF